MSKILEFILFFELTHKELKLYQILAHYHFSIKRYVYGVCQSETRIFKNIL